MWLQRGGGWQMFILGRHFTATHQDFKQNIFQPKPTLGVVQRYIEYNFEKREASRATGQGGSRNLMEYLGSNFLSC